MMHERCGLLFSDPIMGIDPSSVKIGWAVIRGPQYGAGFHKFRDSMPLDERFRFYREWLRNMVRKNQPAIVIIEAPFIAQKAQAPIVLMQMQGVAMEALYKYIGALEWVPNASWKKSVLGNGGITTKEKKEGRIIKELKKLGFEAHDQDEADAIGIALHMRKKLFDRIA